MSWKKYALNGFEPTKDLETVEPNLCCYINPHHQCRNCGWCLCADCFTALGPYQARELVVVKQCKGCGL